MAEFGESEANEQNSEKRRRYAELGEKASIGRVRTKGAHGEIRRKRRQWQKSDKTVVLGRVWGETFSQQSWDKIALVG